MAQAGDIAAPAGDPPDPNTTIGIVMLLAAVFVVQLGAARFGSGGGTDLKVPDLLYLGALNPDLVHYGGEWWRLATAPLLHGGWLHIVLNCVALYFGGVFIERHLGGAAVAGFLVLGAIGGSLASYATGSGALVSVGVSGGIMGLLAGALLLCYTLPEDADVLSGRNWIVRILVPSLIPTHGGVDYAAHFGGAAAGGAVAALLAICDWLERRNLRRDIACLCAVALFVGGILLGVASIVLGPAAFDPDARLLKDKFSQQLRDYTEEKGRELVAKYPGDPQSRLVLSVALYNGGKFEEAQTEALAGLRFSRAYGSDSVALAQLQAMIAVGEAAAGHRTRAERLIAPVCIEYGSLLGVKLVARPPAEGLCVKQ